MGDAQSLQSTLRETSGLESASLRCEGEVARRTALRLRATRRTQANPHTTPIRVAQISLILDIGYSPPNAVRVMSLQSALSLHSAESDHNALSLHKAESLHSALSLHSAESDQSALSLHNAESPQTK